MQQLPTPAGSPPPPAVTPTETTPAAPARRVYITATVQTPDGSDTTGDGEPCEPGQGYTVADGWLDPDWSRTDVAESSEDVRPDTWTAEDGDPVEWLRGVLADRLGAIEDDRYAVYAADAAVPGQLGPRSFSVAVIGGVTVYAAGYAAELDGVTVRRAAHVEGFTFAEVAAAVAHTYTP